MAILIGHCDTLFSWVITASWQSSILICIIFILHKLLKRQFSARFRYYLWFIVIARLLLPVTPESRISVYNVTSSVSTYFSLDNLLSRREQVSEVVPGDGLPIPSHKPDSSFSNMQDTDKKNFNGVRLTASREKVRTEHVGSNLWSAREKLLMLWIIFTLLIMLWIVIQNFRFFLRAVRKRPVTEQSMLDLLEDCKKEMGVHVPLNIIETTSIKTPTLIGFIRPRLLLPHDFASHMNHQDLGYIFKHELAHIKQWDIALNWIMSLLSIIHWFNPMIWYTFSRMRIEREEACDEIVLIRSGDDEKKQYAQTIIKLVEFLSRPHFLPAAAGILEDTKNIKERIRAIPRIKRHTRGKWVVSLGILISLALIGLTDAQISSKQEYYFHEGDLVLLTLITSHPVLGQKIKGRIVVFEDNGLVLTIQNRTIFFSDMNIHSIQSIVH